MSYLNSSYIVLGQCSPQGGPLTGGLLKYLLRRELVHMERNYEIFNSAIEIRRTGIVVDSSSGSCAQ